MRKTNLDFCIITIPNFNLAKTIFVFLTKRGYDFLDESIVENISYKDAKKYIESIGFKETAKLTFEKILNEKENIVDTDVTKILLEEKGIKYNKSFERTIIDDLKKILLKNNPFDILQRGNLSHNKKIKENIFKYLSFNANNYIPKIGDKINLSFYLFVQCEFITEEQCQFNLIGDFETKESTQDKTFLKTISSNFERVNAEKGEMRFKSCFKNKDFFKQIEFTQNGVFRYITEKEKDLIRFYIYNLLEIKNNIDPNGFIILSIDQKDFFKLLNKSLIIREEKNIEDSTFEEIELKLKNAKDLLSVISTRIKYFSSSEEYEKAAESQKNYDFIISKLEIMNKMLNKNILKKEFINKMHI